MMSGRAVLCLGILGLAFMGVGIAVSWARAQGRSQPICSGTLRYDAATTGTALVGGDHNGSLRGQGAIDIQHSRTMDNRVASGFRAIAIGVDARAAGDRSVVLGDETQAAGHDQVVMGSRASGSGLTGNVVIGADASCVGQASLVLGLNAKQTNGSNGVVLGSHAVGDDESVVSIGPISNAVGQSDVAIGLQSEASGRFSVAIGGGTGTTNSGAKAQGSNSVSVGAGASVDSDSVGAVAIGGVDVLAAGSSGAAQAWAPGAVAIGGHDGVDRSARAHGTGGIAIGTGSFSGTASEASISIGLRAFAGANGRTVVIGPDAGSDGVNCVVIGNRADHRGSSNGVVVGGGANGGNERVIAIGEDTDSTGAGSIAVGGGGAQASGSGSISIGGRTGGGSPISAANVTGEHAIGIGAGVVNSVDNTMMVGACPTIMDGSSADVEPLIFTSGSQCIIASEEIDALTLSSYRLDLPPGSHFYLDDVDIVVTELSGGAVTTQPTVAIGDRDEADSSGSSTRFMGPTLGTGLDAQHNREVHDSFLDSNGATSLSAEVTAVGFGPTTYKIRYFFKGMLVKDS